jgi:hypothetical protein
MLGIVRYIYYIGTTHTLHTSCDGCGAQIISNHRPQKEVGVKTGPTIINPIYYGILLQRTNSDSF